MSGIYIYINIVGVKSGVYLKMNYNTHFFDIIMKWVHCKSWPLFTSIRLSLFSISLFFHIQLSLLPPPHPSTYIKSCVRSCKQIIYSLEKYVQVSSYLVRDKSEKSIALHFLMNFICGSIVIGCNVWDINRDKVVSQHVFSQELRFPRLSHSYMLRVVCNVCKTPS